MSSRSQGKPRTIRRRHRLSALVGVLALMASLFAVVGLNAAPAGASHYRANQLTWIQHSGNEVEFDYTGSWRCTFFYFPCSSASVGDTFNPGFLDLGDGTSVAIQAEVTSVDVTNDVISGDFHLDHTYATAGPFTVSEDNCCRLSGPQHINNPDGSVRLESIVNLNETSASPVSSIAPIVDCALNAVCSFSVPAIDPDGQALRWRFATAAESGVVYQPGPPQATNAAAINPTTGVYTWNTAGASLSATGSTFYSTQVVVENLNSAGTVISKTPVDFFIRLGSNSTNQQPVFVTPTPADGSTISVNLGDPVSFDVKATDPDASDTVTLGMLGKPAAATYTTVSGNPATGTFTWTPTALGQTILTITAQDPQGLGATPRSIIINVTNTPPPNKPPVVNAGPDVSTASGTPVALNGSASDPDGDALTLAWTVSGSSCTVTPTNTAVASITCTDPGTYTATLTASDGINPPVSDSATVTVTSVPPVDRTPPTCALVSASSSGISVKVVDTGSGLATIKATKTKNATTSIPAFTAGTTTAQIVTASKIKLGEGASVEFTATDVAGNTTVCDPVTATLSAGQTHVFAGVPGAEHYLSISEAGGVAAVAVDVNGVSQVLWSPDGKTVDLGSLAASNTISVRVLGEAGSSASIMIWDGK